MDWLGGVVWFAILMIVCIPAAAIPFGDLVASQEPELFSLMGPKYRAWFIDSDGYPSRGHCTNLDLLDCGEYNVFRTSDWGDDGDDDTEDERRRR